MSARVQRFLLKRGENHVAMPVHWSVGAKALTVAFEPGLFDLSLWALCETNPLDEEVRRFLVLETDEITKADLSHAQFIGTAVSLPFTEQGPERFGTHWLTYHVFELLGGAR